MEWSEINFAPSARVLRQFAGVWLAVFAGLACWQGLWRERPLLAILLGSLAVAVGVPGWIRPRAIRPVFVAAQVVAFPLGWAISHLLLALLFYGVFTPLGLVFRLLGRDVLHKQPSPEQATYWTSKPAAADVRGYFRPF